MFYYVLVDACNGWAMVRYLQIASLMGKLDWDDCESARTTPLMSFYPNPTWCR